MKHSGLTEYMLRAVVMIRITSVLIPRCLPRPAALQAEEGGTTPPLRKIMTNLTSVTVSTGDVAFLLLPLALPFPVLPWLSVPSHRLAGSSGAGIPSSHAGTSPGATYSCSLSGPGVSARGRATGEASPLGCCAPLSREVPSFVAFLQLSLLLSCLLKIHPLFLYFRELQTKV